MGKYQSGQMGQTVNLLAYAFGGSNPSLPTTKKRNRASSFIPLPTELAISRYFFDLWQLLLP